ncbi:DUF433 domain-containing protein [Candidatus Desantisbacteria bacterium]|nr:DUF433 domain-containing protein [Candidatus Desantisbacteria bacterium]
MIVNSKIFGGKPIIEGTRISVEFILGLLASDVSEEEILEDYSHLTKEDILACLRYAACSMKFHELRIRTTWWSSKKPGYAFVK